MAAFLERESNLRKKGKYPYNADYIDFLKQLNNKLSGLEKKLLLQDVDENYPNIWIIGLPRSGTTLLSQLIFNCFDIACTNNLVARFWKTPLCGCLLSKIILGDKKSESYESIYGKANDICSPHEFSYFWRSILKIKEISLYNPCIADKGIDWNLLRSKILNMNRIFEKGVVFKTLEFAGYHIKRFHNLFKKSVFIYITRDSRDVALSLAKARLDYYNDLEM